MPSFKWSFILSAFVLSVISIPVPAPADADFHVQNGLDAIALNNKFQTLTASSSCTDGENACVGADFAQCVGGRFVTTPCGSGLSCVALPLVNKPGTSITCDTTTDRDARIAATGATAGSSSASNAVSDPASAKGAKAPAPAPAAPVSSPSPSRASAAGNKSFQLKNGKDAQALNKSFQSLTPSSSCTSGENACIQGQFAQCVNGGFVMTSCGGGLTCAALPLVNSPGTSITCVDEPQAIQRIAATGAGNSLTG